MGASDETETEWRAQFEKLGVRNVHKLVLSYSGDLRNAAISWLAQKEEEERLRNEASQAEQMRVARSASRAAWIAAIAAIIAAIAAIVTIVVELMK